MNVINATGGAGVTGHSRGIRARPDGYTLTMMTVEINMFRYQGLTPTSWEDFTPVMLVNRDSTALFVRTDSRWKDLAALTEAVRSSPGSLTASGTASGGIWHLGMAGWLTRAGLKPDAIKWVPMNGAHPALQDLASGGLDLVSCSLPEARILLENGNVRCLGVMAEERVAQFSDVPTFKEQGVDWSMGAWRGIGLPRDVRPEVVERLAAVLERIVSGDIVAGGKRFPDFMENEGFSIAMLRPAEFRTFLKRTDDELGKLLTSREFSQLNSSPFKPMSFPLLLFAALGAVLGGLVLQRVTRRGSQPLGAGVAVSRRGLVHFAEVVLAVVIYVTLAEVLGFVITAGAVLVYLFWRLGTRPAVSLLIALVLTPTVYQLFANILRVPLPRGWLGW